MTNKDIKSKDDAKQFLQQFGKRVQRARWMQGMTRQVLAEKSGISPRYIAHLEAGTGNISVSLLLRTSRALNMDMGLLIGEEDPWDSDILKTITLYKNASQNKKKQIQEILEKGDFNEQKRRKVALIGLRGAGKSTLGKLLATRLNFNFLEIDDEIENESGLAIWEMVNLYGLEGYRSIEKRIIENIVNKHDEILIAVSGGIVSHPEMFNYLLQNYHTIWIKAEPKDHMERVRAQGDERPMSGNSNAMDDLKNILISREPFYSEADVVIDTSKASINDSLKYLLDLIENNFFKLRPLHN